MRIANLVTAGDYWERISKRLAEEIAPRGDVAVESYYISHVAGGAGGLTPLAVAMGEMLHVRAGLQAFEDGCDAIFINAVPDYGAPLLKASVPIPVIGAGEASMAVARTLGKRFSFVSVWPSSQRLLYDKLLDQSGMRAHCASVLFATETLPDAKRPGVYTAMAQGEETIIDQVARACRHAFEVDGADCVILGCTCMQPIAAAVAARFDKPVLDPVLVGGRYAVSVALASAGMARGDATPAEHRKAFRDLLSGAPAVATVSECEVCVSASAFTR